MGRTNQERVEAIFAFIETQTNTFPKSRLKEIGLNPRSAEVWLRLIEYIQQQPKIKLIEAENTLLVQKVEGKYQALMRNKSVDASVPFEDRLQYLTDYLKSLYTRERVKDYQQPTPTGADIQENAGQLADALATLTVLDPAFEPYSRPLSGFTELGSEATPEAAYYALTTWQKEVALTPGFRALFRQVVDRESYGARLRKLAKVAPDFEQKLRQAERTIQSYLQLLRDSLADWFFEPEGRGGGKTRKGRREGRGEGDEEGEGQK
ncbi:MAG: hypothetical protein ACTSU5_02630 [Promethearchaeota archaeon]